MARESLYERIVLGVTSTDRQRGVGTPTFPPETPTRTKDDPTVEEVVAANSSVYAGSTRTVERVGGNKLLKVGLVTTAVGAAGYGIYETVPAVHERIESFLNSFTDTRLVPRAETNTVNPDGVFGNAKTKGEISLKNILIVPREVFDKTPLADAEGNPILDFPWDKNNPVEIKYEKSLWPKPDWWKSGGADVDPNTTIKNGFEGKVTLPAGYEFTAPYPGRVFFAGSVYNEEASRKSPSNPYGLAVYDGPPVTAAIKFIAPNGVLYGIGIGFRNDKGNVILEPLIDDTRIGLDEHGLRDRNWEKGTLVERGQKIFRVPKEGTFIMHMSIGGSKKERDSLFKDQIPGDFQFQTGKDSNGVEKLLVPEGK